MNCPSVCGHELSLRKNDHRIRGAADSAASKVLHCQLFDTGRRSSWLTDRLTVTDRNNCGLDAFTRRVGAGRGRRLHHLGESIGRLPLLLINRHRRCKRRVLSETDGLRTILGQRSGHFGWRIPSDDLGRRGHTIRGGRLTPNRGWRSGITKTHGRCGVGRTPPGRRGFRL